MTKKYYQPTVLVANLAMTSFLCASAADTDVFTIGTAMDPGEAL